MFWGRIGVTSVPILENDRNIFTNLNTAPHLTHDREVGHEAVSEGNGVCLVFIFIGEYIEKKYFARDMLDAREVGLQVLADCVLVNL